MKNWTKEEKTRFYVGMGILATSMLIGYALGRFSANKSVAVSNQLGFNDGFASGRLTGYSEGVADVLSNLAKNTPASMK